MFLTNPPGPWQSYLNRADNKGLPLMEVKSKYMQEQLLFENYMNFQMQQQMLMSQQSSGGGPSLSTIPPSFDPDAQAFITAAAITDPTQQSAINTLVVGLKDDGLWTKMKAIYPIVGGTATTHKYNLKDPRDLDAAFRLQFNGGITHSSTGVLPNGTNGYANTFFIPSVQIANADSFHFSMYSRTNGAWTYPDIGAVVYDGESYYVVHSFYGINANGGNTTLWHGNENAANFADTNSLGLYVGNRNLTGSATAFKNGVLKLTNSAGSALSANVPMSLMALLGEFYGRRELAFSTLGTGLTNTDNTNLYNRIQTFQTSLSRQV